MLSLKSAVEADFEFCQSLTRSNMAPYRAVRGIAWDPERFHRSWREFENFLILDGDRTVGLLRVLVMGGALEIRDLQLVARYTGLKIGTWAIQTATELAAERGLSRVCLRVFEENPAVRLYMRLGFRPESQDGGVIEMGFAVAPNPGV